VGSPREDGGGALKAAVALAALGLLIAPAAQACECVKIDVKESLANAVEVVDATVAALDDSDQADWIGALEVKRRWKGGKALKLTVRSRKGKACGVYLEQGKRYLLFAMRDGSGLRVDLCNHSALLAASTKVLEQLGPPGK